MTAIKDFVNGIFELVKAGKFTEIFNYVKTFINDVLNKGTELL